MMEREGGREARIEGGRDGKRTGKHARVCTRVRILYTELLLCDNVFKT